MITRQMRHLNVASLYIECLIWCPGGIFFFFFLSYSNVKQLGHWSRVQLLCKVGVWSCVNWLIRLKDVNPMVSNSTRHLMRTRPPQNAHPKSEYPFNIVQIWKPPSPSSLKSFLFAASSWKIIKNLLQLEKIHCSLKSSFNLTGRLASFV